MTNMFINSAVLILLIGIFGKVSATIGNDPFDYEESVDLHSGSGDVENRITNSTTTPTDSDGLVSTTEQTTNSTESCSRNITVNSTSYQTFQSPGYPTGYPNNLDCLYTLTAPPGYQIKVELEGYLEDDYDFLSVVEPNVTRKELTGNFQFEILTSINNSLQIRFTSDGSISENGFRAKYKLFQKPMFTLTPTTASAQDLNNSSNINMTTNPTVAIPESCSRNITVNSTSYQTFQSPGYPTGYPNNLDCLYTLTAPPGYQIKVELEGYLEDDYDFLSVVEPNVTRKELTGNFQFEILTSINNSLQIRFTSDGSISENGFRAKYKLFQKLMFTFTPTTASAQDLNNSSNINMTTNPTVAIPESCSRNITVNSTSYQTFQSPGYPTGYPNNLDCLYTLTAPPGYQIKVELEGYLEDGYDFLSIIGGPRFSGRIFYETFTATNNSLQLLFTSDSSISRVGFRARYKLYDKSMFTFPQTTTAAPCGGSFNVTGTHFMNITSPGYPNNYQNNLKCEYIFETQLGYRIEIEIEGIIEDGFDYLQIVDNKTSEFTGEIKNFSITSSSNILKITFLTDETVGKMGFVINYRKVTVTSARPTTTSELSLSCPNTTSCNSKRAVWLCEYIRWRIEFLKNWQKQFEDWRSRFNPEVRTGPYHAQDENDCLSLNISCINPSQRRFTSDYYGCAIQYCADGLYKNGPGMEQWLIDQQHWRSVYELWKNAVANYPEEKCS